MRVLSHIDTLYLTRRFQRDEYNSVVIDFLDFGYKRLGEGGGRTWYDCEYCRLGIMPYDKSVSSNHPQFEIQYTHSYLFSMTANKDVDLIDFAFPIQGYAVDFQIKRIDFSLTSLQDTIHFGAITPFRSKSVFSKGGNVETVYFGKRSTGCVLRVYDKSKEMIAKNSYDKMDLLNSYFGTIDNLVVHELEMHRKWIYNRIEGYVDNLGAIGQVYAMYLSVVSGIRFYEETDKNANAYKNNNYDEIDVCYWLLNLIDVSDNTDCVVNKSKISASPSYAFLLKTIRKKISTFCDNSKSDVDILAIISDLILFVEIDGRDYISLKNSLEDRRDNQNNLLEIESCKHFT